MRKKMLLQQIRCCYCLGFNHTHTGYHLATPMRFYINVNSVGFSEGLNYVGDCADITLYKDVYKLIFEVLEQEQHYKMMMDEDAEVI